MQLDEVSQCGSAVNSYHHRILELGAEANSKTIGTGARAIVWPPGVRDLPTTLSEDVGCSSCAENREKMIVMMKTKCCSIQKQHI